MSFARSKIHRQNKAHLASPENPPALFWVTKTRWPADMRKGLPQKMRKTGF